MRADAAAMGRALDASFTQATDIAEHVMSTRRLDYRSAYQVVAHAVRATAADGGSGRDITSRAASTTPPSRCSARPWASIPTSSPTWSIPSPSSRRATGIGGAAPDTVRDMADRFGRAAAQRLADAHDLGVRLASAEAELVRIARSAASTDPTASPGVARTTPRTTRTGGTEAVDIRRPAPQPRRVDRADRRGDGRSRRPSPILNLADDHGDGEYDAIFVGGGAGGRFGAAYMKAMGGRPLIIDAWPFLGGSCPHQACVPHHLFSEAAEELDRMRWFSDELFFPKFDADRARILDLIDLFRAGRGSAHAFMNWQTKEQLEVEYVLNAHATIVDAHTVTAAGKTFQARNSCSAWVRARCGPRSPASTCTASTTS